MIDQLIHQIEKTPGCTVTPPQGQPITPLPLPKDLQRFYDICGGVMLFENSAAPLQISSPEHFVPSNQVLIGYLVGNDPSDNWYLIGKSGEEQLVSLDLNPQRLGRCYDSFWDRHGVVGSCSVVALSFSEFLQHALSARGSELYWLSTKFAPLGDAYD